MHNSLSRGGGGGAHRCSPHPPSYLSSFGFVVIHSHTDFSYTSLCSPFLLIARVAPGLCFSVLFCFFSSKIVFKKKFFWGGRLFSLQFHFFVCLFVYLF